MKGYRTIIVNGLLAICPVALDYLAGVDWTQYMSPQTALVFVGIVNIALRAITTTPMGKKEL